MNFPRKAIAACAADKPKLLREALDEFPEIPKFDSDGETLAHLAAAAGAAKCIAMLLADAKHCPPYPADRHGADPLYLAACEGSAACARLLLPHCDPNRPSFNSFSPLLAAVCGGHAETASLLLPNTAHPESIKADNGRNLLEIACANADPEMAELLLPFFDPNSQDPGSETDALTLAVYAGCPKTARLLLLAGADPNPAGRGGLSALHCAAAEGSAELVAAIQPFFSDAASRDRRGNTPIHAACLYDRSQTLPLLLAMPGGKEAALAPNDSGKTPLALCAQANALGCARALSHALSPEDFSSLETELRKACAEHPNRASMFILECLERLRLRSELAAEVRRPESAPRHPGI